MTVCSPPACLGSASFVNDDRLFDGRLRHRSHETLTILHALDVGRDDFGFRIPREVIQELAFIHIQSISIADDFAKPKPSCTAIVREILSMASTLRKKSDRTRF